MQLSHLSLLNSITYDQRRRDKLINYRNSCSYIAGIIVPGISWYSFSNFTDEFM
jgi:Na+/melibiose symporter-like transporter